MNWDENRTFKMRGGWPNRLGSVIGPALDRMGPAGLLTEARVRKAWPALVGDQISANAWVHRLRGSVLEVSATEDAWSSELRFLTEVIRDKVNARFGAGTVSEVVVRRPRNPRR